MKKAQVSIEIITLIGLLVVFYIIINVISQSKKLEISNTETFLEKRNECLKLSNLISSVYASGDGTLINTTTSYVLTIYNTTYIGIRNLENATEVKTSIAILASEAGETTQTFYDVANQQLRPNWYKNCFSDIDQSGCQSSGDDVNYSLISANLSDLICNDLNKYNVIYLEDPHLQDNATCGNKTYLTKIQDWVSAGNSLITAEHIMCREQSSGSYASTSYRCNPSGYNSDIWTVFSNKLHQQGGSFGNGVTVTANPDPTFFPDLNLNDKFDFEENSYVEQGGEVKKESESMSLVGGFTSTSSCICNSPSNGNCIRHEGSTIIAANATWVSNITGTYELSVNYCGENDGDDNWTFYKNNQLIDNWLTSGGEPNWETRTIQNFYINSGDTIKLSCDRGTSNSYCRSDYIKFTPVNQSFNVVGKYDADLEPAILYWNYGSGKVFYFGDFQVASAQNQYSQIISEVIKGAYSLLLNPKLGEEICSLQSNIDSVGEFSGNIMIRNSNNRIILKNV